MRIGKKIGRSADSIRRKIRLLRRTGEIEENTNNRKDYSSEEIEFIKKRYLELIQEGLNDAEISKMICRELGRSAGSIGYKIRQLKRKREFADAEALRERQDILGVVEALEEFGEGE